MSGCQVYLFLFLIYGWYHDCLTIMALNQWDWVTQWCFEREREREGITQESFEIWITNICFNHEWTKGKRVGGFVDNMMLVFE